MMGLTEGTGHLFYDGMPFLMYIILIYVRDTLIGNVSITNYKMSHTQGEIYVCMSNIDWKLWSLLFLALIIIKGYIC